jgi:ElaB/YqjD/DUF883 family membrane-anchored ribosome-binding protein
MSALLEMATAGNGAFPATDSAGRQFAELFDGVDDLIHRVAHTECPEILKLRAKVYASMVAAKDAIEDDAHKAPIPATQFADSIEEPLPGNPGRGFGVALLLGLGLGFISTLRQEG